MSQREVEADTIKAVHISDVHIDMEYMAGTNSICDSLLCCREDSGMPGPSGVAAGEWGSNQGGLCDLPQKTFANMLDFVVNEVKPDVIFWTGDNSAHDIWKNTVE